MAYGLWDAANTAIVTLSTTFLIFGLGFTPEEVPLFFLISVVFSIFAAIYSPIPARRIGLKSATLCMLAFGATATGTFALIENDKPYTKPVGYTYGALFGSLLGGIYPLQRFAYVEIIPGGREVEMLGLFAFAGQVLNWAPPLVFVILNETSGSIRFALITPCLFYVAGFLLLFFTVDIDSAKAKVAPTLVNRTGPAFESFNAANSRSDSNVGLVEMTKKPIKIPIEIDNKREVTSPIESITMSESTAPINFEREKIEAKEASSLE